MTKTNAPRNLAGKLSTDWLPKQPLLTCRIRGGTRLHATPPKLQRLLFFFFPKLLSTSDASGMWERDVR